MSYLIEGYCTQCGRANPPANRFCATCGQPLASADAASADVASADAAPTAAAPAGGRHSGGRRLGAGIVKVVAVLAVIGIQMRMRHDPVRDDLSDYLNNRTAALQPLEASALDGYSNARGLKARRQALSAYRGFVSQLKAIRPATKEVQDVHAAYVRAATTQMEGFAQSTAAIEKQDARQMAAARMKLDASHQELLAYKDKAEALAREHDAEASITIQHSQPRPDPVADDLLDYLNNRMQPLNPLLDDAGRAYERFRKATSDRRALRVLRQQVIPKHQAVSHRLRAIQPRTREVREIHALYLRAQALRGDSLSQMADAIENRSLRRMKAANDKIAAAIQSLTAWDKRLDALTRAHDLVQEKSAYRR